MSIGIALPLIIPTACEKSRIFLIAHFLLYLSKRCGSLIQASPKEILGMAEYWPGYDTGDLEYITSLYIKTCMHTYIYTYMCMCACIYMCVSTYIQVERECLFTLMSSLRHTGTDLPNALFQFAGCKRAFHNMGRFSLHQRNAAN